MVRIDELLEEKVMELLQQIPDPDIPVINIVELGIVRGVVVEDEGKVIVTITPTYSGCPAMNVFIHDIKVLLHQNAIGVVEVRISHTPAWTTDWLSEATKEKMRKHGIAPPETSSKDDVALFSSAKQKVKCPHCGSQETKLTSQFGSTPCKAIWYCNSCLQGFEYFKCY
jgi:ring-1,2-phenylacetyl-CoA epoxidase subunit PaaD